MNDRLAIRVTSFALAAAVTLGLLSGLDTLAQEQHSGGLQMSQSCTSAPLASAKADASALPS